MTTSRRFAITALAIAAYGSVVITKGCDDKNKETSATATASATPVTASAAPTATATAAPLPPRVIGPEYPKTGVKLIPKDCSEPAVVLPGKGAQSSFDVASGASDLSQMVAQLLWAKPQLVPTKRATPQRPGVVRVHAIS